MDEGIQEGGPDNDARTVRKAVFSVDGKEVARKIPAKFNETLEEHLEAIGRGLLAEEAAKDVKEVSDDGIDKTKLVFSSDDVAEEV